MLFADRREAGRLLAARLSAYAAREDVVVLALPRGGVPVGHEVAAALGAPLDVFLVRKLGAPGQPELAMGAIAGGGLRVMNEAVVRSLGVTPAEVEAVARQEERELQRRERDYRGRNQAPALASRTVILVDDGLATGASMRAAVRALRGAALRRLVVAVPVAPPDTCADLGTEADEVVCVATPEPFFAVGRWYQDFRPTTDEEVRALLAIPPRSSG